MIRALEWRIAALKNGMQDALAYRMEFLLEILGGAFVPAGIQLLLWYCIFKIGGAQTLAGMKYEEFLAYTGASVLFSQIRGGDLDFELQEMIRSGQLSNYLLRPVGVVEFVFVRGIAGRLLNAIFCLIIGLGVFLYLGLNPLHLIGAMMLALLGNVIHYQIGAALSTTAFFWEEAFSILMVKNLAVSILSGELIPLNLFPEQWQWIWKATPIYLYVFGPVQFALGKWTTQDFFYHFGIGILWSLGIALVVHLSWKICIKRYKSLGG
jgi:ABC-2 type transport system permease protein